MVSIWICTSDHRCLPVHRLLKSEFHYHYVAHIMIWSTNMMHSVNLIPHNNLFFTIEIKLTQNKNSPLKIQSIIRGTSFVRNKDKDGQLNTST